VRTSSARHVFGKVLPYHLRGPWQFAAKYRADQARDSHGRWTLDSWGDLKSGAEHRVTLPESYVYAQRDITALFDPTKAQLSRWTGEDVEELRGFKWEGKTLWWNSAEANHHQMIDALHNAKTGIPTWDSQPSNNWLPHMIGPEPTFVILNNWDHFQPGHKYSPDEPRDDHGRWTSEGGASGTLAAALAEHGGFTYQPASHDSPKEGYALSIMPGNERVIEGEITPQHIQAYMDDHAQLFRDNPNAHFGAWRDPASGKVYLDISIVEPDRATAISLGKAHGQISIYNLGTGETVNLQDGGKAGAHSVSASLDSGADRRTPEARAGPEQKLEKYIITFVTRPRHVRGFSYRTP
jgi:hypothetical protein